MPDEPFDFSEFEAEMGDVDDPHALARQQVEQEYAAHVMQCAAHLIGHLGELCLTSKSADGQLVRRKNGHSLTWRMDGNEMHVTYQLPAEELIAEIERLQGLPYPSDEPGGTTWGT